MRPFGRPRQPDLAGTNIRHRGLIKWQGKTVTLLNRKSLEGIAEFLPGYLYQDDGKRN